MRFPFVPVILVCLVLGACRGHILDEGTYALTTDEVLEDDCGLLGASSTLWGGQLKISGDTVRMHSDLFGIDLTGNYREVSEQFYLDGSASQVSMAAAGGTCAFSLLNMHLDGESKSPTQFTGTLSIDTASDQQSCRCHLAVRFHADHAP